MKVKIFSVLVVVFLGTYSVNGQVDFFNNSEETARRLDSMEGRDTPQRRENRENRENNRNNRDSGNDNPVSEILDRLYGPNRPKIEEAIDEFDTPETRCIFIMVVYLDAYLDLVERIDNEQHNQTVCDGYALQLLAIGASTSIMYCPESLANKSGEWRRIWDDDLMPILENEDNYGYLNEWKQKLDRITNPMDPPGERISDMLKFFQPDFIVNQLLSIQQNMEAFDCPE